MENSALYEKKLIDKIALFSRNVNCELKRKGEIMSQKKNGTVQPIKNVNQISRIRKLLLADRKFQELAVFDLGMSTALRISDILKLKWEDLIIDGKFRDIIVVSETKTSKGKEMPLPKESLQRLYKEQPGNEFVFQPIRKGKGKNNPGTMTRQHVNDFLIKYYKDSGGDKTARIGSHSMRKGFGYIHYQKNRDLAYLMEIFNHSSQAITLRYIGITQEEINRQCREIMDIIGIK